MDPIYVNPGLDFADREKIKHHAKHQAHHLAEQRYGRDSCGYEYVVRENY
jgi:hypothetical protein